MDIYVLFRDNEAAGEWYSMQDAKKGANLESTCAELDWKGTEALACWRGNEVIERYEIRD